MNFNVRIQPPCKKTGELCINHSFDCKLMCEEYKKYQEKLRELKREKYKDVQKRKWAMNPYRVDCLEKRKIYR